MLGRKNVLAKSQESGRKVLARTSHLRRLSQDVQDFSALLYYCPFVIMVIGRKSIS